MVIQNVRLFDGRADLGQVNVGIDSGKITAITTEKISGNSIIEGKGKYLIPGMINAHVHVSRPEHLRESHDIGVLHLLNMHTGLEEREKQWKNTYKDSVGYAFLYGAGHAATVPGGHPNQFSPEMETINDSLSIAAWMEHRIAKEVDYIKIVREHHEWMGYPPLPTLEYDQIADLIEKAHDKGLKAVIHSNTVEEMIEIARMQPDGFVHMPEYKEDYPISENFYSTLIENGIFVVPNGAMSLKPLGQAPPNIRQWIEQNLLDAEQRARIIGEMHKKGVLIVAGTDAQEGQMNFGDDYYLELQLYKMAGMSNLEILKTATVNPAKAFGLPIGTISIGSDANMVLLGGNPLDDLENLKLVEQVWKQGKNKSLESR